MRQFEDFVATTWWITPEALN